jgi:hypothetical protein
MVGAKIVRFYNYLQMVTRLDNMIFRHRDNSNVSTTCTSKQELIGYVVGWLIGFISLTAVKGFGLYEILFMKVCAAITVIMAMLLRDFGLVGHYL